jgi:hypothetical protein
VSEASAREAIFKEFADRVDDGRDQIMVSDAERIASAHGVYPVSPFAEDTLREALLTYLGVGWGVGPRARLRDKISVRWAILKERFQRA